MSSKDTLMVCSRFRPQNKLERSKKCFRVIAVSDCNTVVQIVHPDNKRQPYEFSFDRVFNTNASQSEVYNESGRKLVDRVMEGYNCTIFAYGQTGTGKTYTMEGELGSPIRGIVPRVVETIFRLIEESDEIYEFVLKVSYCEIYKEKLRDLINPKNRSLKIRESKQGVYIQGITEMYVRDENEVMNLMVMGAKNRTVQSTNMNQVSSRSHGVFMLKLINKDTTNGSTKFSKLLMVDLAGSEKVAKTGAVGNLLEEAKKINQSLSALGNVMNALTEGASHIPYRNSVLTKLLADSLGGNCKTCLMVAASESSYSVDETISTMRFGERAKKIKNRAKINAEKTIAEYKKEVMMLNRIIQRQKKHIECLQADLLLSREGKLTDENCLSAKFERGEEIVTKEEVEEEVVIKPRGPVSFASDPFARKTKKISTRSPSGSEKKDTEASKPTSPEGSHSEQKRRKELKATADGGLFSIGDKVRLSNGRKGIVQRVFYIEDVDVRWEDNHVTRKIPAPNLTLEVDPDDLNPDSQEEIDEQEKDDRLKSADGTRSSRLPRRRIQEKTAAISISPGSSNGSTQQAPLTLDDVTVTHNRSYSPLDLKEKVPGEKNPKMRARVPWSKWHQTTVLVNELQKELEGIHGERMNWHKAIADLRGKIQNIDTELTIKSEALQKERSKVEEAEAECGEYVLKLRALEDQFSTLEYEKKKVGREKTELQHQVDVQEREREKLKSKIDALKKEAEQELNKVRREEKARAKKFIEAAQKAINRTNQPAWKNGRGGENKGRGPSRRMQSMQADNLKEIKNLKLEQFKLEQDLRSKVDEVIQLKMKGVEKDEQIGFLQNSVKTKEMKLRHQHDELSALGKLKLESDTLHSEKAAKYQERISKLKRIITKMKQKRMVKKGQISRTRQKKMRNMRVPLRGGGGKKKSSKRRARSKKKRGAESGDGNDSPTGSVASSYVANKYTNSYASVQFNNHDAKEEDNMSLAGSQVSYQSYKGLYIHPNVEDPQRLLSPTKSSGYHHHPNHHPNMEGLPDLPIDDVESVMSNDNYSTYSGMTASTYNNYAPYAPSYAGSSVGSCTGSYVGAHPARYATHGYIPNYAVYTRSPPHTIVHPKSYWPN